MNKALLFILLLLSCISIAIAANPESFNSYDDSGDTSTLEHKGSTNITDGDTGDQHHWTSYSGATTYGVYTATAKSGIQPYSGKSDYVNGDGSSANDIQFGNPTAIYLPTGIPTCFSARMAVNVTIGTNFGTRHLMLMGDGTQNYGVIGIRGGGSTGFWLKVDNSASTRPIENQVWERWAICQNSTAVYNYYWNRTISAWQLEYKWNNFNNMLGNLIVIKAQDYSADQYIALDDLMNWNGTINVRFDPPVISSINLTSETPAITTEPYTTTDSTPTFKFMTDENAWCRISSINQSYILMGTQCSGGEAAMEHTCTLSQAQALNSGIGYVYVACNDTPSNYHTILSDNEQLIVNVTTSSSSDAQTAINSGILQSKAAAAVIYTDKQVYIRALNSSQYLGTFDKVAVLGTKRWLFNYVNVGEDYIGAPTLDSTVYVWENSSLTESEITTQVARFINATYG
jgi:hypothetical protein